MYQENMSEDGKTRATKIQDTQFDTSRQHF